MKPKKIQTLIVLFALLVIGFLYQLPTSVIKTKNSIEKLPIVVTFTEYEENYCCTTVST